MRKDANETFNCNRVLFEIELFNITINGVNAGKWCVITVIVGETKCSTEITTQTVY